MKRPEASRYDHKDTMDQFLFWPSQLSLMKTNLSLRMLYTKCTKCTKCFFKQLTLYLEPQPATHSSQACVVEGLSSGGVPKLCDFFIKSFVGEQGKSYNYFYGTFNSQEMLKFLLLASLTDTYYNTFYLKMAYVAIFTFMHFLTLHNLKRNRLLYLQSRLHLNHYLCHFLNLQKVRLRQITFSSVLHYLILQLRTRSY